MPDWTTTIIALGVLTLLGGFAVAPVANNLQDDQQQTLFLEEGQAQELTDRLRLSVTDVNTSAPKNMTVTLRDEETRQTDTQSFNATANGTYTLANEQFNVSGEGITANGTAQLTASWPRTYGWQSYEKGLGKQLPLIFILSGGLMMFGGLLAVTKP